MSNEWIVAVFPSRAALTTALDQLKQWKQSPIRRAAIVAKAESGEIVVVGDDIGVDEGGIAGGTLGLGIGALGMVQLGALAVPGIGAVIVATGALAGALLGSITARIGVLLLALRRKADAEYQALASQLRAGSPALVLELRSGLDALPLLQDLFDKHRAEVLQADRTPVSV
ncbi:MAG: hypothetical protein SF162_16725 [bacterium]|nr:hypothetical protein [bacterium]